MKIKTILTLLKGSMLQFLHTSQKRVILHVLVLLSISSLVVVCCFVAYVDFLDPCLRLNMASGVSSNTKSIVY